MPETTYHDRSDSVDDKLRLLQAAYGRADLEVAMSLCESIRDTLTLERTTTAHAGLPESISDATVFSPVSVLPAALAGAAAGWQYCKHLVVTEGEGLRRSGELVDVAVGFRADQVGDLRREVRVLRLLEAGGAREIPCQVHGECCSDGVRRGRVMFVVDAEANSTTQFLVLFGNPAAQLPRYTTDLTVSGQGCGLRIDNHHYGAQLADHTGQMERLSYHAGNRSVVASPRNTMSSGLELYAGGDGHGEAPHIDWAHDYAAAGQFQKFRLTNWGHCPNFEVLRGPLCVRVRRWGFAHGPAHPLFTPSRLHFDVTYSFVAGQPWFLKDSCMTVLRDFEGTVRDDEWVFTGQPFTDTLWMDRDGALHEGDVAASHEQQVWGLGFFHRQTRDAFTALFLEHSGEGCPDLMHGGAPQLDYQGIPRHAQLWSRSPTRDGRFRAGAVLRQRNAYVVSPYDGPAGIQNLRRRLMHPLRVAAQLPAAATAVTMDLTQPQASPEAGSALVASAWAALRQVPDDMFYTVDANVVDMGYIYDVRAEDDVVHVLMTMPHAGRPRYGHLAGLMRQKLLAVHGVRDVIVGFTQEPAWTAERLSAKARCVMGLDP